MTPGLLAERDGVPVVAIALTSGAVLADPGDQAEDAVRLLKLVRYRVMRQGGYSGDWRSLLRGAGSYPVALRHTEFSGRRHRPEESRAISVLLPCCRPPRRSAHAVRFGNGDGPGPTAVETNGACFAQRLSRPRARYTGLELSGHRFDKTDGQ
jgi:hypothetical protein